MKNLVLALSAAILATSSAYSAVPDVTAAIKDAARPQADKDKDVHRKPAEMVAFAGIKAGDQVIELLPGGGYFTRIFSKVVGPKGHVYGWMPAGLPPKMTEAFNLLVTDPAYTNTSLLQTAADALAAPTPADVVWTSQNYHDLHNRGSIAELNSAVFKALKPGGIYVVLDHTAPEGSGDSTSKTLHRIDPALVKQEVTSAGFKFEGQSDVLVNKDDAHTLPVFDPSLRGTTDQFVFKFRKPK